jgi:hypothetical protein
MSIESEAPNRRDNDVRGNFGSNHLLDLRLPEGVTPGSYEVFLRTYQAGRAIGDGMGSWITVPTPGEPNPK